MYLLFYSPQFLPSVGGLQYVVHHWAIALSAKGHRVVVVCQTAGPEPEKYKYRVVRNPGFWRLVRLMRQSDLVIMFNTSLKVIPQWILSGTPLMISHHTAFRYAEQPVSWQQQIKKFVANWLASANIACSKFIAVDYRDCQVVQNPYDDRLFYRRDNARIPNSLLCVGRLVSDKGIDLLIKALAVMKGQTEVPVRLNIIGTGPQLDELKALTAKLEIAEQVSFLGSRDAASVAVEMSRHQVLVVPSRMEPFGIVVLEGLAAGCAVVSSNQGGLPEAGGGLVHYFETGSVEALAATIRLALRASGSNKEMLVKSHLRHFSPGSSANRLESILTDLKFGRQNKRSGSGS